MKYIDGVSRSESLSGTDSFALQHIDTGKLIGPDRFYLVKAAVKVRSQA